MATFHLPATRFIIASGFAAAIGAGQVFAIFAIPAIGGSPPVISACPSGESLDIYSNQCLPHLVPNSPSIIAPASGIPTEDNIPCTGRNIGVCEELADEASIQESMPRPHSTISSSP